MYGINVVLSRMKKVKEYMDKYESALKSFRPAPSEDDPEYKDWYDEYIEFIKNQEVALWRNIFGDMLRVENWWNVPRDGLDFLYSDVKVGRPPWSFGYIESSWRKGDITEEEYYKYRELDKPVSLARALGYDRFYYEVTKIPVEKRFLYINVNPCGACVDGVYYDLGNYWIDVCNKDMVEIVGGLNYKYTDVYPVNYKVDTWTQMQMIGEMIKDVKRTNG